jgi:site-specific DNA-methyltransferase (adenine-specific)
MQNQDVLMSSGDDSGSPNWETPDEFYARLNKEHGPFVLDAAATAKNSKCIAYLSSKQNALESSWNNDSGSVFCNPPYGRGLDKWVEKAAFESRRHRIRVVMLVPARTDTKWYHEIVLQQAWIVTFVKGRIQFHLPGKTKNSATFPSMVIVFDGRSGSHFPIFTTMLARSAK